MATAQELTRRAAIEGYRLIGQPVDPDLEGIAQVAATVCGVPRAVVNIIDDSYQHQVATVGFAPSWCSRDESMCAVVFENPGHVVVSDAREDPRFAANPFVTGELADIRFYASSPLITPSGVPIGTLCVFDIVVCHLSLEQSRALRLLARQVVEVLELRRSARVLLRTNAELARFAGQVSHDLRSPLNAVSGFIEIAADDPDLAHAPHAVRALERAESAVSRMDSMIVDLLDYARTGGAITRSPDLDLERVVRTVADDLDASLRATRARVVYDAALRVSADATLLRALIQNLIANAVKFASAVGHEPFVEVRASRVTGGVRVTVDDNGPGVPPEDRERVFIAMERGDHSIPGIGLGLATCRRIVEAHGGSIGIDESELGGASVWFFLPDTPP